MGADNTPRLADTVVAGNIVVTVPWQIVSGDNEGIASSGTATYTIAIAPATAPLPNSIISLLDDLDRINVNGLAVVT